MFSVADCEWRVLRLRMRQCRPLQRAGRPLPFASVALRAAAVRRPLQRRPVSTSPRCNVAPLQRCRLHRRRLQRRPLHQALPALAGAAHFVLRLRTPDGVFYRRLCEHNIYINSAGLIHRRRLLEVP
jgi:hypothetical protein